MSDAGAIAGSSRTCILRRLAGTAHSKVNAAQWGAVCAHLDEAKQSALEALLVVDHPDVAAVGPQSRIKEPATPRKMVCRAPRRNRFIDA
jgi:hypothetical protein